MKSKPHWWWDKTVNPIIGCSKESAGCTNCWAEGMAYRLKCMGKPQYQNVVNKKGWTGKIRFVPSVLDSINPSQFPKRIWIGSMTDLFHGKVENEWLYAIMEKIRECQQHTFFFLTKRPHDMLWALTNCCCETSIVGDIDPIPNLYCGLTIAKYVKSSIDKHKITDFMLEDFYAVPAQRKFISCEPLLSDIQFGDGIPLIDQVIIGCESGPNRRPCHLDWVYNIVDQCKFAGVKVFVKQLDIDGKVVHDINKFPKDLQIRELL